VWAVVFAHSPPLPFAKIRPPFAPKTVLGFVALLFLDAKKFALALNIGCVDGRILDWLLEGERPYRLVTRETISELLARVGAKSEC
jgi:hypothetical protein